MYADDLLLLSGSLCDLQSMVDICCNEFDKLDMCLNVKKSQVIRIGSGVVRPVKVGQLPRVSSRLPRV